MDFCNPFPTSRSNWKNLFYCIEKAIHFFLRIGDSFRHDRLMQLGGYGDSVFYVRFYVYVEDKIQPGGGAGERSEL